MVPSNSVPFLSVEQGDLFLRQTRGISQGDIIHQIRTPSGTLIKTPIVYDNKEDTSITKKDREKSNSIESITT